MVATTGGGMNGLDALLAMYGGGQGFGGFGGGMSPFGFGGGGGYPPMMWPGMGGGFGAQSGVGAQGGGQSAQPMPFGGNPFAALMMAAQQQQGGQPLPGGMGAMPRPAGAGSPAGGVASTTPGGPASAGLMNPSAGGSVGSSNSGPASPPTSLAQPMPAPAAPGGNPLNRNLNGASLMANGGRAGGDAFERILGMVEQARRQPRSIAEIMASYGRG